MNRLIKRSTRQTINRLSYWGGQIIFLVMSLSLLVWFAHNAVTNLARQGIASGFDFWHRAAGFDIIMHLPSFTEDSTYGQAFWVGLCNTLLVATVAICGATILGFMVGFARLSKHPLVSRLGGAYVEIVRNLPLLLHLFIWYFVVLRHLPEPAQSLQWGDSFFLNMRGLYGPKIVGIEGASWGHFILEKPVLTGFDFQGGWVVIPEFVALVLALTIYTAAFIGEVVRAGILAVPKGQWEAAHSLGLNRRQTLRFVIIPQALRIIVPPLTSQYLNLTKNSSLAAAIAFPDLVQVFAGTVLMQTGQAVEVMGVTMGVYLLLSLTIAFLMNTYHRRTGWVRP